MSETNKMDNIILNGQHIDLSPDYRNIRNKPTINGISVDGDKTLDDYGLATKQSVENVSKKIDKLPYGMYYGQYDDVESLPNVDQLTEKGYAYVATTEPNIFYIYIYNGEGEPWQDSGNKFDVGILESNLSSKSKTKAPTTKAVKEGIEAVDITATRSGSTELSAVAKYNASANINDRAAQIDSGTSAVVALGYKVLNPNLSFASQVTDANTIYEIKDEFDLSGESVTIPENCTLKFNGGKLKNGTVIGNDTVIYASRTTIFNSDVIFNGTFVGEAYPEWVGNDINKCVNAFKCVKLAPNKTYQVDKTIVMPWKSSIVGEKTTILNTSISPVIDMGHLTLIDNFIIRTNHTDNVINISTENMSNTYYSRKFQTASLTQVTNIVITSSVQVWKKVTSIPSNPTVNQIIKIDTNEIQGFEETHYYRYHDDLWEDITSNLSDYGIYNESSCIQILCDGWCPGRPNNLGMDGISDITIDNVSISGRWKYGIRIDNGTHAGIDISYLWITDIRINKLWCYYILNTFYITRDDKGGIGTHSPSKIYISNCSTQFDNSMEYYVLGDKGNCFLENCIPWDWSPHAKYQINQGSFNIIINNSTDFTSGFDQAIKQVGVADNTPGFNYNMPEGSAIANRIYGAVNDYALNDLGSNDIAKNKNIRRLPYGIMQVGFSAKFRRQLKLTDRVEFGNTSRGYLIKAKLYGAIGLALIMRGTTNNIIAFNLIPSSMGDDEEIPDWRFIPSILHMSSISDNVSGIELLRELNGKTLTVLRDGTWHDALGHYFTVNQFVPNVSQLASIPASQKSFDIHGGKILLDKSTNKLYSYNNTTQTWNDSTGVEAAGLTKWYGTANNIPTPTLNKGIGSRFLITDLHRWVTWFGNAWYYDDGTLPTEFIQVDQSVVNFDSAEADSEGKIVTVYISEGIIGSVVYKYNAIPAVKVDDTHIKITTTNNPQSVTQGNTIFIIKDIVVTRLNTFPSNPTDGQIVYTLSNQTLDGVSYPMFNFYQYTEDSSNWLDITTTFISDASKVKQIKAYQPGSVITVSPSSYEFPAEGGSQEFIATTYSTSLTEVTIVPVDADWITKGTIADKKITLTAAENTGAARQVSVTFKDSNSKTATIVITQKAGIVTTEE